MAAMRGHGRLARILLDHNADPKIYTNDGQSPSDIAYSHGHNTVSSLGKLKTNYVNNAMISCLDLAKCFRITFFYVDNFFCSF